MPTKQGLSIERLDAIGDFIQRKYLDTGRLPCAQMAISRHGETVWQCTLGSMDIERARPLQDDTVFRIYSMTKPMTSVAFMMLVERGLIALDDPVTKYIPDWQHLGVFAGGTTGAFRTTPLARPMQVIDLLRHTSGLTYGFQQRTNVDAAYRDLKIDQGGAGRSLAEMVDLMAQVPLEFSPGAAWNYSMSVDVLGYLIEKITGDTFEAYLHDTLIEPLGMVDTGFHVPAAKASRFAACYVATPEGGLKLLDDPTKSPYQREARFFSGGGGLLSTVVDYQRFCQMLLNGGQLDGRRYISRKTLELMGANHLPGGAYLPQLSVSMFAEASYNGIGFGLGFSVVKDAAQTLIPGSNGELAWGGMASTAFWVDPLEDLSVVFMTQLVPSSTYPIRRQLRTMVYSALND